MKKAWMLFAVALLVRLVPVVAGWGERAHVMQSPDCVEYERTALNLLDHRMLSSSEGPEVTPDSFRTPGYPGFIAAVYAVAGRTPHAVVALQAALAAGSCVLLALWAAPLVGEPAAWIAGVAWALDIGAVANATLLLSETLCLFLLMGAYAALGNGADARRANAAGFLLGLAALTRPAVLYWAPVAAFGMLVASGRRAIVPVVALAIAFAAPCTMWVVRNAVETGVPEFSSLEGKNLLYYRASGVMARVWGVSLDEAWKRLAAESEDELNKRGWPRSRHGQVCKELAGKYLSAHPLQYLPVLATGAVKAWTGLSVYDLLKHFGLDPHGLGLFEKGIGGVPERLRQLSGVELAAVGLELAQRVAVLALGALGLVVLLRRRAWTALAVLVPPLIYVTLTSGTVLSYYRFRLPLVPFFSVAVGVAVDGLWRRARARRIIATPCAG